jgi:dynein heavy chain
VPQEVRIKAPNSVENIFAPSKNSQLKKDDVPPPLFQIELLKTSNDDAFIYSNKDTSVFSKVILQAFDKALEEMSKIPDLERKILSDLYKSKGVDTPIKTPMKP